MAPPSLIAKLPTIKQELGPKRSGLPARLAGMLVLPRGVTRTPLNVPRAAISTPVPIQGTVLPLIWKTWPLPGPSAGWMALPFEQAKLALRSIARLHATWWKVDLAAEPELAQMEDNTSQAQHLVDALYRRPGPRFLERGPPLPFRKRSAVWPTPVGRIAEIEALLDASPRTLMHGDFRLDNLLFGSRNGVPACWVIDWEDVTFEWDV